MERRRRSQQRRERLAVVCLIEETEAFLAGRYLEVRAGSDSGRPAWAQLNWLSHADPDEVSDSAPALGPSRLGSWSWAVAVLTGEVLELTGGDRARIRDLQRSCLIPLELTLMMPSFWNVLPAEVVALAVARLRAHPSVRRRDPTKVPPSDER